MERGVLTEEACRPAPTRPAHPATGRTAQPPILHDPRHGDAGRQGQRHQREDAKLRRMRQRRADHRRPVDKGHDLLLGAHRADHHRQPPGAAIRRERRAERGHIAAGAVRRDRLGQAYKRGVVRGGEGGPAGGPAERRLGARRLRAGRNGMDRHASVAGPGRGLGALRWRQLVATEQHHIGRPGMGRGIAGHRADRL